MLAWKDWGKIGLPEALGINPWVAVVSLAVVYLGAFAFFEKRGL